MVTGASAGIGRNFAELLAQQGVNLVIVARSRGELDELADDLRRQHKVKVEVLTADLTKDADLERVSNRLRRDNGAVDVLVNNAGIGSLGPMTTVPLQREEQLVRLNVLAMLRLSRVAATEMVRRGEGTILNVSSLAAYAPIPYFAVYGATKAFVFSLTLALREELRGTGVSATVLAPGFVDTDFGDKAGLRNPPARWLYADPERVARDGLRGAASGDAVVLPGMAVRAAGFASQLIPPPIFARVAGAAARRLIGGSVLEAGQNTKASPQGPPPEQVIHLDENDDEPVRG